jgi:hypothetical protein
MAIDETRANGGLDFDRCRRVADDSSPMIALSRPVISHLASLIPPSSLFPGGAFGLDLLTDGLQ